MTTAEIMSLYELFQSTLPRGERPVSGILSISMPIFQSTLPRGERLWWKIIYNIIYTDFNPRSREGSDRANGSFFIDNMGISIHAPARGATCVSGHCSKYD